MQSGNIFITLFGAVAIIGILGAMTMSMMRGPVTTTVRITDRTLAKNDIMTASASLSEHSLAQDNSDCDADGTIEPPAYRSGALVPTGGGLLPSGLPVSYQDPWKHEYGYCAWDHGVKTRSDNIGACGGLLANRLNGASADTQPVLAVISAGPNGVFETSCHAFSDTNNDGAADVALIQPASGGDDVVKPIAYGQFLMPSSAQAKIEDMPDAACTSGTVGVMRITLGVMQVCTQTGWAEIAPAAGGDLSFNAVTNAVLGGAYQSNVITFGVLPAPLSVSVGGGALLSINGGAGVASGTINSGNTLKVSANAPATPETTASYAVHVGGVIKNWSITTRDAYIAQLSISPVASNNMTVTGPGAPAYGTTVGFILTNNGERASAALQAASLSPATNFAFDTTGGHVGDSCAGKTLRGTIGGSQSCVIDIRPKATADGSYQATLNVGDGLISTSATLSGSATGWNCTLPWGGTLMNGNSVTAYLASCSLISCTAQTRTCTNGVLSGTYTKQTCNVLLSC